MFNLMSLDTGTAKFLLVVDVTCHRVVRALTPRGQEVPTLLDLYRSDLELLTRVPTLHLSLASHNLNKDQLKVELSRIIPSLQ